MQVCNVTYICIDVCISQAQTSVLCAGILDSLKTELRGTKDFSKLYSGIAILGYIASISDPINTRAFAHLLTFLGHRYPKVCCAKKPWFTLILCEVHIIYKHLLTEIWDAFLPDQKICC